MPELKSVYHARKREAIESFLGFAQGREFPKFPLEVFLEISNLCDLQCAMCVTFSALNPERPKNIRRVKRAFTNLDSLERLDEILKHAVWVHAFGYGEPTIHTQFKEILDKLRHYEVLVDFFTNGMHLTEELCATLVRNKVFRITISFSGANKEDYEKVYLKGHFETVIDGISRLAAAKKAAGSIYPRIDINSIAFNHHVEHLSEFVDLMSRAGANHINLKPLSLYANIPQLEELNAVYRPHIEGRLLDDAQALAKERGIGLGTAEFRRHAVLSAAEEEDYIKVRKVENWHAAGEFIAGVPTPSAVDHEVSDLLTKSREGATVRDKPPQDVAPQNIAPLEMRRFDVERPCLEPFKTMYIHGNGNIRPCCFMENPNAARILGNAIEDGARAWTTPNLSAMREGVITDRYPTNCGACLIKDSAPKHHNVNTTVAQYSKWFWHEFGVPFHSTAQQGARTLTSNREIVDLWRAKKDDR